MKKKLVALALLTASASAFATPISTPVNVSDTPIIGGNNGTCGTVDLTNATSDYELKPCETAVIRFNNQQLIPLHIAIPQPSPTQPKPVIYEITVTVYQAWNMDINLYPNGYRYPNAFRYTVFLHGDGRVAAGAIGGSDWYNSVINWYRQHGISDRFVFDTYWGADNPPYTGTFKVVYYGANYPKHMTYQGFSDGSVALSTVIWNDTTTQWTFLGVLGVGDFSKSPHRYWQNISGQIIVKRIL